MNRWKENQIPETHNLAIDRGNDPYGIESLASKCR